MKWQDWYLVLVVSIAIIAVAVLPIVFPSETYLQALKEWAF
jgi:hypothetical protein